MLRLRLKPGTDRKRETATHIPGASSRGSRLTPIAHQAICRLLATIVLTASFSIQAQENTLFDTAKALCKGEIPVNWQLEERRDLKGRGLTTIGELRLFQTQQGRLALSRFTRGNWFSGIEIRTRDAQERPSHMLRLDQDCRVRVARKLAYSADSTTPSELVILDASLQGELKREPLDPPVPVPTGQPRTGPLVGLIDAGVNYLLAGINNALARDSAGNILGYDFWDMDPRPFDNQSRQNPFVPKRHGTRTASIILDEAPNARLVPYRYPDPDMSRMKALVDDAASKGIRILAMPLGSKNAAHWNDFEAVARRHSDILFIASAGNDGFDIDEQPIYPAALELENLIVVTSIDENPRPAYMSNWGRASVDLMVPAEKIEALDFNGLKRRVSGSSYAVSRLAAMAARLLEKQSTLRGSALKNAILDRAVRLHGSRYVSYGVLPDPLGDQRRVRLTNRYQRFRDEGFSGELTARVAFYALEGSGWQQSVIRDAIQQSTRLFQQCNIALELELTQIETSEALIDFRVLTAQSLMKSLPVRRPAVVLMRDSKRSERYEGEAFGSSNTPTRPWLRNSVWLTQIQRHPGITLTHELIHVFVDNGNHVDLPGNIMNAETRDENVKLTTEQCSDIRASGLARGLLSTNTQR